MIKRIYYDFETTGLNVETDLPLQIAAVDSFGNTFERKIKVPFLVPEEVVNIHGLNYNVLENKTELYDAIQDFISFVFKKPEGVKSFKRYQLIAHNGNKYDHLILHRLLNSLCPDVLNKFWWCVDYLDSIPLIKNKYPELYKLNLGFLCNHFQIPFEGTQHNAIYDCKALKALYEKALG